MEKEMRSTASGSGQFSGHSSTHYRASGFVASLIGKWQEYRMLRDAESLPYAVMKDIGFRAAEHTNAK
jgi:hypothetical protein